MTDAAVIGSGPNGLVAAVILARAGLSVTVYEADAVPGGGCRTEELTLAGFRHDYGSAVHPLAFSSPFFARWGLADRVPYAVPEISYAHALDAERAAVAYRDIDRTADGLGRDGRAWRRLLGPLSARVEDLAELISQPLRAPLRDPLLAARLGASTLGASRWGSPAWRGEAAPALLAGVAAHGGGDPRSLALGAVGVVLAAHGHGPHGWPLPRGGAGAVTEALLADLYAHGGRVLTGTRIASARELPEARVTVFDTSARELARLGEGALPEKYARALRSFRYGPASAKVDFALSAPVPWSNPRLAAAPTVHLGGTAAGIADSERAVARGRIAERPYVLVTQPSLHDPGRAPAGRGVLWAYAHVPAGSTLDPTELITAEIERHAPGFRDLVLASAPTRAVDLEARNPNLIGGDIASGATDLRQLLARPVAAASPWRTPHPGFYLCSAAVPPGPGVHGRGGDSAARAALEDLGLPYPELGRAGAASG